MAVFFFVWLIISLFFFIIELAGITLFFFLSCACGAIFAAVSSLLALSLWVQFLIFFSVSILFFIGMRFVFNPYHYEKKSTTPVYLLLGRRGLVVKNIVPGMMGQARIGEEIWAACTFNNEIIIAGEVIEVLRVQGYHL